MWSSRRERAGRLVRAAAIVLAVAAMLAAITALTACKSAPTDSGIVGTVTIGPTQPVSRPGTPDTRPYAAELSIAPKVGLHLKRPATVTSAEDGSFKVNLEPGSYVISTAGSQSPPTLAPVEVVVQPHQFATVELSFDSGIR